MHIPAVLIAFLGAMRVQTSLLAALATASGLSLVAPSAGLFLFLPLMVVVFCATAGGFLINDYFDVEKDRINHPRRALPSGKLSRRAVLSAALVNFGFTLLAASLLSSTAFALVLLNLLLLSGYSCLLAFSGFLGNIVAAYLGSSLLLLAGLVAERPQPLLPYAVFIFFVMLSREIVFDIRDVRGDAAIGLRTLPIQIGARSAFRVAWAMLGLATLAMVIFWLVGLLETVFMSALTVTLATLAYGLQACQANATDQAYSRFVVLSRVAFLLTIVIFWIGTASINRPTQGIKRMAGATAYAH